MKRALRVWMINSPLLGNGVSYADIDKLLAAVDKHNAAEIAELKRRLRILSANIEDKR